MKKYVLAYLLCTSLYNSVAQNVVIPDANFKAYLLGNSLINTNNDSLISVAEAEAFNGTINCSSQDISDLTGIEFFLNLEGLVCSDNNLTSLDVSQNAELTRLSVGNNELDSLVLLGNPKLESLFCRYNKIQYLDLSKNQLLKEIYCTQNKLTHLDISQNTNLKWFYCDSNSLEELDLSNNPLLETLHCGWNNLFSLDINNNPVLTQFWVNSNKITSLDLSQNNNLTYFDAAFNQRLVGLNIKNLIPSNFTFFRITSTYMLSCITVDDPELASATWTDDDIGSSVSYAIECPPLEIPDENFKAYLVGNLSINTNGDSEISAFEATAFSGTIDCSGLSIGNLNGIEMFSNLANLYCNNNLINSLNLAHNPRLRELNCSQNYLGRLNVRSNNELTLLDCSNNEIELLDLESNPDLSTFLARSNRLHHLNMKNQDVNVLSAFDATDNPSLSCIEVIDSSASAISWPSIDPATSFSLECLPVDIPDSIFKNYLINQSEINVNADLEISFFEASNFYGTIGCSNMNIYDLTGIEAFTNITRLYCSNNQLTSLDLTNNILLTELSCRNNNLRVLDLSNNTRLIKIYCEDNDLIGLDLKNLNINTFYSFDATKNPFLTCIEVDDVAEASLKLTRIDSQTGFSTDCPGIVIADSTFKNHLIEIPAINTDGDDKISVFEAAVYSGFIDCSGLNIEDLSGLEKFSKLTGLDCSNNNLRILDVSANQNLTTLNCSANLLRTLDLGQNLALSSLNCQQNKLIGLNLRNISVDNLTSLNATDNAELFCIDVEDEIKAQTQWLNIDTHTNFSKDCPPVYIPDERFKEYLLGNTLINTNGDSTISVIEAASFTGNMNVSSLEINDLTGIEAFENLTYLNCSQNNLYELNLHLNEDLEKLVCFGNMLDSLSLTFNLNLTELDFRYNRIQSIDLLQNTKLEYLDCSNNNLQNLDLSGNPALLTLYATHNNMERLNIRSNTALTSIACNDNHLVSLDLSRNTSLENLTLTSNQLTYLDISQNLKLNSFLASRNNLIGLNMKNLSTSILSSFYITDNEDLRCIEVDDVLLAKQHWYNKDYLASFNEECPPLYIPDNNFKAYLVANPAINVDGDNEISILEAATYSGYLNCEGLGIYDLSGIEAFTSLTGLNCSNNFLDKLNLSQNLMLTSLDCSGNQIRVLDLWKNSLLTSLICEDNSLVGLNMTGLNASILGSFNARNNPLLTCIEVDDPSIASTLWTSIDDQTSYNKICPAVYIPDENFKTYLLGVPEINLNSDTVISLFEAVRYDGKMHAYSRDISDLTGIEEFSFLTELDCSNNDLASINLRKNSELYYLNIGGNELLDLDISQNHKLVRLSASSNNLKQLDISKNKVLKSVTIFNNQLEILDLSESPAALASYAVGFNQLIAVNLRGYTGQVRLANNENLYCIYVDDVETAESLWRTSVDSHTSFSTNCPGVIIPDTNFKACLLENEEVNIDMDSTISYFEAFNFTGTLNCSGMGIEDLTGIERFERLTILDCSNNSLENINISKLDSLTELLIAFNDFSGTYGISHPRLSVLDISNNSLGVLQIQLQKLKELDCSNNVLYQLYLSWATGLRELNCSNNDLLKLSLENLTQLQKLDISNNRFDEIDLALNTELQVLDGSSNNLALLNVRTLVNLEELNCSGNDLLGLDVSQHVELKVLDCSNNELLGLNMKGITSSTLTSFDATNNLNLSCIEVDDPIVAAASWVKIDLDAGFSTECPALEIPDPNFKAYLVSVANINTNNDDEISIVEAINYTDSIDCSGLNISDLTGIEGFRNLYYLDCSDNSLDNLNMKNFDPFNLRYFDATNNPNLYCIEVSNPDQAAISWINIDTQTSYGRYCTIANTQNILIDHLNPLYPNPTKGEVIIELGKLYPSITVVVRNSVGQIVEENVFTKTSRLAFSIPDSENFYIVELIGPSGKLASYKVIKL